MINRLKTINSAHFSRFMMVLSFVFLGLISSSHANAPVTACDPKYYDTLKARAWLEAQREVMQNQNLIYKPDSVLEYTCFDKALSVTAGPVADIFSDKFQSVDRSNQMKSALQSAVGGPSASHINTNFGHTFLGGRAQSLNYAPAAVTKGGSYNCDSMNKVWELAKCMNFAPNQTNDGFFTLAQYANLDPRFLPSQCALNSQRWQQATTASKGSANTWLTAPVVNYAAQLTATPQTAISTGITAIRRGLSPSEYQEKVCLAPGYVYKPTSIDAGTCVTPNNL